VIHVPDFNPGDELTRERFTTLIRAIRELQALAVQGVQPPVYRGAGGSIGVRLPSTREFWAVCIDGTTLPEDEGRGWPLAAMVATVDGVQCPLIELVNAQGEPIGRDGDGLPRLRAVHPLLAGWADVTADASPYRVLSYSESTAYDMAAAVRVIEAGYPPATATPSGTLLYLSLSAAQVLVAATTADATGESVAMTITYDSTTTLAGGAWVTGHVPAEFDPYWPDSPPSGLTFTTFPPLYNETAFTVLWASLPEGGFGWIEAPGIHRVPALKTTYDMYVLSPTGATGTFTNSVEVVGGMVAAGS